MFASLKFSIKRIWRDGVRHTKFSHFLSLSPSVFQYLIMISIFPLLFLTFDLTYFLFRFSTKNNKIIKSFLFNLTFANENFLFKQSYDYIFRDFFLVKSSVQMRFYILRFSIIFKRIIWRTFISLRYFITKLNNFKTQNKDVFLH